MLNIITNMVTPAVYRMTEILSESDLHIYEVTADDERIFMRRSPRPFVAAIITRYGRVSFVGRVSLIGRRLASRPGAIVVYLNGQIPAEEPQPVKARSRPKKPAPPRSREEIERQIAARKEDIRFYENKARREHTTRYKQTVKRLSISLHAWENRLEDLSP